MVNERLEKNRNNICEVEIYYSTRYNNLKKIDGNLSKWGIFEESKKEIEKKIKAKRTFIRDLAKHSATEITNIGFSFNCIINNISEY